MTFKKRAGSTIAEGDLLQIGDVLKMNSTLLVTYWGIPNPYSVAVMSCGSVSSRVLKTALNVRLTKQILCPAAEVSHFLRIGW